MNDTHYKEIGNRLRRTTLPNNKSHQALAALLAAAIYLGSVAIVFATSNPPTVSSPTVFSLQTVAPKVDGTSGALTQNISLDFPPGRNGLQPALSLQYNSQNTGQDSIVGYGWSLGIPYIARMYKTGSQNMYGPNPYFTSSLDGELAFATTTAASSSIYRARVDEGSFRQYTYATSTNSWMMYDQSGTKYLFGAATQSQQSATTSPSNVYKWMLEKVVDTNGNYIRYVYNKDGNQIYPYQIIYTGNGVTDGPMTITFATSTRPDKTISFKNGFEEDTNYRISQIVAADNLGSTDAVTNASGTPVQMIDYLPYGSTRIASSTAGTDEKHKYIGQYYDASGLLYDNARYYNGTQGQFLTEDPLFWSRKQNLVNPQSLNSYSYANDNPINRSDPSGLFDLRHPRNRL